MLVMIQVGIYGWSDGYDKGYEVGYADRDKAKSYDPNR